jgi:hypothetical protein
VVGAAGVRVGLFEGDEFVDTVERLDDQHQSSKREFRANEVLGSQRRILAGRSAEADQPINRGSSGDDAERNGADEVLLTGEPDNATAPSTPMG